MTPGGQEVSYRYGSRDELPHRSLPGFDHVNRFWDPIRGMVTCKILPGEYYATRADELISTVLGSCVSACIWDPRAGVGGMNHFMIPDVSDVERDTVRTVEAPARYGIFAMELLINTILKHGGQREMLQVKIAGGGSVVAIETGIGDRNVEFVLDYLARERLTVVGAHVGGTHARKVIFHPISGRAEVLAIQETRNDTVVRRERDYAAHFKPHRPGDIELFEEHVMDQRARKTRVLIVDDSALVRKVMMEIFESDPAIEVVGTASDPYAARDRIKELNPDVLTLDVEMPKMDGITFLGNLMRLRPMPVVMVSSLTEAGADVTLTALELGAVDYITKPKLDVAQGLQSYADELIGKVKAAALARPRVARAVNPDHQAPKAGVMARVRATDRLLAIGASTGGTEAIREVLEAMPADAPPTLITQHIPEAFSKPFADRLDRHSQMRVAEATHGTQILPGHAYVAPGNRHLRVKRDGARYICQLDDSGPVNRHKPSVDVLFDSVADQIGVNAVAVLLTGMGADGAKGLKRILEAGAPTIAQDEATSVVWGMPGEAVKLGGAREVLPLGKIAHRVLELVSQ